MKIKNLKRFLCCLLVITVCVPWMVSGFQVKAAENVYKISILFDDTLMGSRNSAPCDVIGISKLYTDAGHNVSVIDRSVLADEKQFNTRVCDILILPTGENFPLEAVANFKNFVAAGGRVITLGGYAFSSLLAADGTKLEVDRELITHLGKDFLLGSNMPLYAQDQLRFDPSQLPIFDEEHYFDYGTSIRPAEEQAVFDGELELTGPSVWNATVIACDDSS